MKDDFITARIPAHIKARLDRTGNASLALRAALEDWIAREDKLDAKARQRLAQDGILQQVRMCLVTAPPRQGEGSAEWAERVGLETVETEALDRAVKRWK